jgi:hypothetical protein
MKLFTHLGKPNDNGRNEMSHGDLVSLDDLQELLEFELGLNDNRDSMVETKTKNNHQSEAVIQGQHADPSIIRAHICVSQGHLQHVRNDVVMSSFNTLWTTYEKKRKKKKKKKRKKVLK